ncbi:DUF192 domain-containing protein [Sphingomonas koreensis]|nr:DUF192 domain-containing protein [Sphingomonas koreensis]
MSRATSGRAAWLAAGLILALPAACSGGDATRNVANSATPAATLAVTIEGTSGRHRFTVERARTAAEQERGLMYRTDLTADGDMLFAPYPPEGGAPKQANFWMKNTPSPLDILFIRADHSIARIAENAVPFDETPIPSGEPVAAVLELKGGRAADLGIAEGDKVSWNGG